MAKRLPRDIQKKLSAFKNRTDSRSSRQDVYINAFSGFGGARDPMQRTSFQIGEVPGNTTLETLYRFNWVARRIVEAIPEDAIRQWIEISIQDADLSTNIQSRFDELCAAELIEEALSLARLYGGALMIIGATDGKNPAEPLDENKISEIRFLTTLDRWQVAIGKTYDDPMQPNFGKPKTYRLQTAAGKKSVQGEIHESRVIRFNGSYLPERTRISNQGWCDSVIVSVNDALKHHGTSVQAGAILFQDFITKVLKIPNLAQLIADNNESTIMARIQYAIANMSSLGVSVIGQDEEMQKIQTPITGLVELIEKYIDLVSAASGIPKTRLFGQQLGTLSGADETTRNYYDLVKSYQKKHLRRPIHRLISLLLREQNETDPGDWSFEFCSLWQPTEKETAETRKLVAETDEIYIENNVLYPEEVAVSRFGSDGYSPETIIDTEARDRRKNPVADEEGFE